MERFGIRLRPKCNIASHSNKSQKVEPTVAPVSDTAPLQSEFRQLACWFFQPEIFSSNFSTSGSEPWFSKSRTLNPEPGITRFVYGMGGGLIGEYQGATAIVTQPTKEYVYGPTGMVATIEGTTVTYLTADHLGTPRVLTDAGGAVVNRRDVQPFGEDIPANLGGRSEELGYGADSLRQRFTGYEKDEETGLDFAQARYFGNHFGRFQSPDPYNPFFDTEDKSAHNSFSPQPQYWNRYTYAINNPQKFIDPDGQHPAIGVLLFHTAVRGAVGAFAGAAVGAGLQVGYQYYKFGEIRDKQAIIAGAVDGAIFGAAVGAAGPIGAQYGAPLLTRVVFGGVGSALGGSFGREIRGEETTTGDVITDTLAGALGSAIGYFYGRLTAPQFKYIWKGEGLYSKINSFANRLGIPRSITNEFFDGNFGTRIPTFGDTIPASIVRGVTRKGVRATRKKSEPKVEILDYFIIDPQYDPKYQR